MEKEINKNKEIKEKESAKKTIFATKNIVILIVLGLLIVFSGVQTIELMNLKNTVDSGSLTVLTSSSSNLGAQASDSGADADALQKSLENLPDMVGGC